MKVTLAIMVMCGAGIPTVYGVFQGQVRKDRSGQEYFTFRTARQVGTVQFEGRATAADYYQMAARYETPDYPAFCWDYKP